MRYSTILFDLDGTLTDPAEGIVNSILYALEKMGIEETDREKLLPFIGPPLAESFRVYYGVSQDEATRAVTYYREYYADKGIFENRLYPGIPEFLAALNQAGATVALATSKPEVYAEQILQHFGIASQFDFIGGSLLNGQRVQKGEVIAYVLSALPARSENSVLMVGDRKHDVIGARENGLPCAGVLFGYGGREELTEAGAVYLADSVHALWNWMDKK